MVSNAARYLIRAVVAIAMIAAVATGALWGWQKHIFNAPGPHVAEVFLLIEPGDGHTVVRWELHRAGLIHNPYYYDFAQILAGDDFVPKAGEFLIPARASLAETLNIIDQGRSHQRRLTVLEGTRVAAVIEALGALPMLKGEIMPLPQEGHILPETYFYTHGTQRQALLDRMQERREIELIEAWLDRDPELPLQTPEEALILASIVELETGDSAERREVAGVFVNRLRRGMRLQSDPTVLYGLEGDLARPITKADLKRKTPWNTYMRRGLPETAICNPSRDAVLAVMQPAKTANFYFVSDGEGGLLFAKTLDAHNKNVRLFRKRQAQAKQ